MLDKHFIVASKHGQEVAARTHVDAPWAASDTLLCDIRLLLT